VCAQSAASCIVHLGHGEEIFHGVIAKVKCDFAKT
jgi:hypothetical protein